MDFHPVGQFVTPLPSTASNTAQEQWRDSSVAPLGATQSRHNSQEP